MPKYPLDNKSEVKTALHTSLQMHSPRLPAHSSNEDLSLNPLKGNGQNRTLSSDFYRAASGPGTESAIDDVVSAGDWQNASYVGPDATPSEPRDNVSERVHERMTKPSWALPVAVGAAGFALGWLASRSRS